jgi:hypothetical protein
MRRTRGLEGDAWEAEAPLGEASEAYEVDILDGANVLRTLTATQPSVIYEAADELTDFGSLQASLRVRVVQLSATVGRGIVSERLLTL